MYGVVQSINTDASALIIWSARNRLASVNNIASWLSFFSNPLYLAFTKPQTTIELGARYARVSELRFDGATGPASGPAAADDFKPRLSSVSGTIGVRHVF